MRLSGQIPKHQVRNGRHLDKKYRDNLTTLQSLFLIQELDSAKHLLAYGIQTMRNAAFIDTAQDPILTMLSIGVEKQFKLALGLLNVEDNGEWLPSKRLKDEYGHDLIKMDRVLRKEINSRLENATHRSYVEEALTTLHNDPVWIPFLKSLSRYGKSGRFYYIDALADSPQLEESPKSYWEKAEKVALATDPELKILFNQMVNDFSTPNAFNERLNSRLADSIQRWWDLVKISAIQGVFGDRAKSLGHQM